MILVPSMKLKNIDWGLSKNPLLLTKIYEKHRNNFEYLNEIDALFGYFKQHKCKNTQEKMERVGDLERFYQRLSEFRIAQALIRKGKNVEFTLETGPDSIPDIHVADQNFDAYIEVKMIVDDPIFHKLIECIEFILKDYSFKIMVYLNSDVSKFTISGSSRKKREELLQKGLQEFKEKIELLEDKNIHTQIDTSIGTFDMKLSINNDIYKSFVTNITIPDEDIKKKIHDDIISKIKKKKQWLINNPNKKYIIAIDFERATARYSKYKKYLEEVLINKENGMFNNNFLLKNVSGVIGNYDDDIIFICNPYAVKDRQFTDHFI